jgi:hypothetical protein
MALALLSSGAFAETDLSAVGHVNQRINREYARVPDSCLPNAREKVKELRALGVEASIIVVHKHGAPDNHAIVHIRLDGTTYYLNNNLDTLAKSWNTLYDIVRIED